jgi:dihydrofolate synthase/folylpolyglutamate synthase
MKDLESFLITHFGNEVFTPGLLRMREALGEDLISFLNSKKIVTIAGTNGKGETTLRLSNYLGTRAQCVWTSPHIQSITERFRSEEGEIEERLLGTLVDKAFKLREERGLKLSYYEFLFLVFSLWVKERNPEFILLEVGLGGRLDAVNVLDASLVLLPSISRDHQEFLGNRYELILREKLGVLRQEGELLTFLDLKYLREKASERAKLLGVKCRHLEEEFSVPSYEFSKRNDLLARVACKILMGENPEESHVSLAGRGERVFLKGEWYLTGSHNVDGMRKLIQFLNSQAYTLEEKNFDFVIASFSKRDSKDLRVMMKMLKLLRVKKIFVTVFRHPKAAPLDVIEELCREEGLEFVQDIYPLLETFKKAKTLVTGSYYFLGEFKSNLRC